MLKVISEEFQNSFHFSPIWRKIINRLVRNIAFPVPIAWNPQIINFRTSIIYHFFTFFNTISVKYRRFWNFAKTTKKPKINVKIFGYFDYKLFVGNLHTDGWFYLRTAFTIFLRNSVEWSGLPFIIPWTASAPKLCARSWVIRGHILDVKRQIGVIFGTERL